MSRSIFCSILYFFRGRISGVVLIGCGSWSIGACIGVVTLVFVVVAWRIFTYTRTGGHMMRKRAVSRRTDRTQKLHTQTDTKAFALPLSTFVGLRVGFLLYLNKYLCMYVCVLMCWFQFVAVDHCDSYASKFTCADSDEFGVHV